MAAPDTSTLRDLAVDVAQEAAAMLARARPDGVGAVSSKSSATDLVTELDRRSEELIVQRLLAQRPDDAILGEEGGARAGTSGVRWVIDPLDGTINFVYGYPAWAVSIAAEVDGEVVAGAVVDGVHAETWAAVRGGGATLDGAPLSPRSAPPTLGHALVATGFSYDRDRRAAHGRIVASLLEVVRDVRRGGAAALDLCWAAGGRVDAYVEQWLQPWDLAAGSLVAVECGLTLSDGEGGPARPDQVLATPAALLGPLEAALARAGWPVAKSSPK